MAWSKPECSGPAPSPRKGHCAILIGTNLVIHGGLDGEGDFDVDGYHEAEGQTTQMQKAELDELPPQVMIARRLSPREYEELEVVVPRDQDGLLTSIGSIGHMNRKCIACAYFKSPLGCKNGIQCQECHIAHIRKNKYRPCKGKRERMRRLASEPPDSESRSSVDGSSATSIPTGTTCISRTRSH